MIPDDPMIKRLLQLLIETTPQELDCEDVLHSAAAFVEWQLQSGQSICGSDDLTPIQIKNLPNGVRELVQHLKVCPECDEEVLALRQLLLEE